MKYTLLSNTQLESLPQEFAIFLASQSIDKAEWDLIKLNKPELVSHQIELFSDIIWEKVLENVKYLEHFTNNHIFLFCTDTHTFHSIIISTVLEQVDFCTTEGMDWIEKNWNSDQIIFKTGVKNVYENRNFEIFELIKKGASISKGELYQKINLILNS